VQLQDVSTPPGPRLARAQLKKAWIAELSPKDSANLLVTLTSRAGIEQLTCKVIRECLKLKLAPFSVGRKAINCRKAGQSASVAMNALCFASLIRIICFLPASLQQKTALLNEM
jgi:hypothetical protein